MPCFCWCVWACDHIDTFIESGISLPFNWTCCILIASYIMRSYRHSERAHHVQSQPQGQAFSDTLSCLDVAFVFATVVFQNMQQSESLQDFFSKSERIIILENLRNVVFNCPKTCKHTVPNKLRQIEITGVQLSFSFFLQCTGALVSPWFRDKGRGPHPGHLVSNQCVWVLRSETLR